MGDRHSYLDRRPFLAFAHRGGTIDHPENTLEAFQSAVDHGFEYLETDVHASRDGELYAFHDDDLDRVAGIPGAIGDLDSSELDGLRFDGYRLPRFDEVLSTWPTVHVNVDPKSDSAVVPLTRALRRHGAIDRVCVGSFSDRRIAWCRRELGPELCTSMGPREVVRLWLRSRGLPTAPFETPCAQVPRRNELPGPLALDFDARFVETAHELGIDVHVWTLNDADAINEAVDIGVDGIMTDRPDVLRSVLIERGRWGASHV